MRSSNELNIENTIVLADVNGPKVDANQVVAASAQLVIAGTGASAPAGNFLLQWSDDPPIHADPSHWVTFGTVAVSAAGTYSLAKADVCYQWIRSVYDNTATITKASLTNQSLIYTAVSSVASIGNGITIILLDPGAINQSLSVTVVASAITVHLATDGAGVITSTGNAVKAAVNAHVAAALLVLVTGSNVAALTALSSTPLASGTDGGTITSSRIKTIGF
jgi:hypothetical protein